MKMTAITKPMLAINADLDNLKFDRGLYATVKLDGIRCLIVGGKAVSRNFKAIPNVRVRDVIEKYALEGMDGEIIIHDKKDKPLPFNEISSYVMSHDKIIPTGYSVKYYVFDFVPIGMLLDTPYVNRMDHLKGLAVSSIIKKILPVKVKNYGALEKLYFDALADGFEGLIMRSGDSPYKLGRSTVKEGWLLKMKPFDDSEAVIIDLIEGQKNENEKECDAFGDTKRSSKKENMRDMNTLGAFKVRDMKTNLEFSIGTGIGLTKELRQEIWNDRKNMVGKIVKYRSQNVGVKELPRFPSFIGFRSENDMGE